MSRYAILGSIVTSLIWISAASAETPRAFNYPWCAHYMMQSGPKNCGFTTLAQCWQSVSGIGGFCDANPAYIPAATKTRKRAG